MATRHDTQRSIIRHYMMSGKSITQQGAINLCNCFRLSAIIYRLRHDEGITICMDQPEAPDKPYARYWIDKEWLAEHGKEGNDE